MIKIAPLAASLVLALLSTAAKADPPTRALMPEGIHSVLSDADYPDEAIRKNEQGTVAFRLDVGSDGKPTACSVLSSSGSATLDATTCRIMMERPRFQPARDAKGKPTTDQITSRITWRLPQEDMPPRMKAAFALWTACVMGEASKLVPGDLPANLLAERAFPPCAALEGLLSQELKVPSPLVEPRNGITSMIEATVTQVRHALETPPDTGTPQDR